MTAIPASAAAPAAPSTSAERSSIFAELSRDRLAIAALVFLVALVLATIFAQWIMPFDPGAQQLRARLVPPFWLEGGNLNHLLGTDNLGRDVFSRVIYGAGTSLSIAATAVCAAAALGILMGVIAGLAGGWIDSIIMRVVDIQVSLPDILLALTVIAVIGSSWLTLVIILFVGGWMVFARITRSLVAAARHLGYVEAAELAGAKRSYVILRHILPNLGGPLIPLFIMEFARAILIESGLSFLGLGIQPPAVSWGLDLAVGKDHVFGTWWLVTFPGLAIALTILSTNLLANWAETTLDPAARGRRRLRGLEGLVTRGRSVAS